MFPDRNEYKFLIIEDNPGDVALVEDFLYEKFEAPMLHYAADCSEAICLLGKKEIILDVILLDLSLPDKTGEALIQEIMNLSAAVPVVVLTGYADFDFGVKSLSLGICDYLLKDELTALSLYKSIIYSVERQKAIAALKESERKYSDLFNFSPLAMWVVDLRTLRFVDVNQATIDQYGYSREEFLSMTLTDIRPVEELNHLAETVAYDMAHPDQRSSHVMIHKLRNGLLRDVEVQIAPIQYNGRLVNLVVATDITDQLKYIKAIEDQNKKLKQISWMQSHVIRAPLSRMMGLINLFKAGHTQDEDKIMEYLLLSAEELDGVIKDITDLSNDTMS